MNSTGELSTMDSTGDLSTLDNLIKALTTARDAVAATYQAKVVALTDERLAEKDTIISTLTTAKSVAETEKANLENYLLTDAKLDQVTVDNIKNAQVTP